MNNLNNQKTTMCDLIAYSIKLYKISDLMVSSIYKGAIVFSEQLVATL